MLLLKFSQLFLPFVWALLLGEANAHIGDECNLGLCMNSLLIKIRHTFCDSNNICQCDQDYVQVALHKCGRIERVGGECDYDVQCQTKDQNSFCDRSSHFRSVCECRRNFQYDTNRMKCVPVVKKPKSTAIFPLTAVLLIIVIAVCCGCGILCHNFYRSPMMAMNNEHRRGMADVQRSRLRAHQASSGGVGGVGRSSTASGRNNGGGGDGAAGGSSNTNRNSSDNVSASSKFDDDMFYDEPPPKYEDAIKEYPTEVVVDSQPKRSQPTGTTTSLKS